MVKTHVKKLAWKGTIDVGKQNIITQSRLFLAHFFSMLHLQTKYYAHLYSHPIEQQMKKTRSCKKIKIKIEPPYKPSLGL